MPRLINKVTEWTVEFGNFHRCAEQMRKKESEKTWKKYFKIKIIRLRGMCISTLCLKKIHDFENKAKEDVLIS